MNGKNIFIKNIYISLILLSLLSSSASASIIFLSSRVDGGIGYGGGSDPSTGFDRGFGVQSGADRGAAQLQAFNYDLFNQITWRIKDYGVTIRSTMTAIPEDSYAWGESHFSFRVQGAPVNYSLEASVDMINTRFMRYPDGSNFHECLSLGCDYDWLKAGKTTGTLSEGYIYALEFSPSHFAGGPQHSEFLLQVPEPPALIILTVAFFALIFKQKSIENMQMVRKYQSMNEQP
ncbi:hypothetical protein CXF72_04855 [Psychromonas sp. MB-3u-54]|uniref:hypothetical protein n=1 Tax=Psychromonas sp. MB-3u-54 TaxID=2058319 RepID=UPI000C32BE2A|nr:hypothetical protein [Psychromonas sp. MB-3u-54]PKH03716.1 hypothetical protein CXF72_04855 [Psychromonas sp. MB-3u-54]